jgi:hypothetical protein
LPFPLAMPLIFVSQYLKRRGEGIERAASVRGGRDASARARARGGRTRVDVPKKGVERENRSLLARVSARGRARIGRGRGTHEFCMSAPATSLALTSAIVSSPAVDGGSGEGSGRQRGGIQRPGA